MGLVETIRDVATLVQKTDNIKLVKHVLSLQMQAQEMQEDNRRLREQVKRLEGALDFAKALRFDAPFYFSTDDKIPYCAHCWEADHLPIHLKRDWDGNRWECFHCGKVYLLKQ